MLPSERAYLHDARARLLGYIQEQLKKPPSPHTYKVAFDNLMFKQWHYFFALNELSQARLLCQQIAVQFYKHMQGRRNTQNKQDKLLRAARLLCTICLNPRFNVYLLPKRARQIELDMQKGRFAISNHEVEVQPAGLAVPFDVDWYHLTSTFRQMFVKEPTIAIILHEMAHFMEKYRVEFTKRNHDRDFDTFHTHLRDFYFNDFLKK